MDKLDPKTDGATPDIVGQNIDKLRELFPEVFTEDKVDFDTLRETLGDYIDDRPERYSFTWNSKSRARRIAQTPSTGTLRPCPEESVNWDTTKNLFIEGDNLEVLKLLQKSYHKKIKMIYIDPPYNTGKEFIYPDKFADNLGTYLRYTHQIDEEGLKLSANTETSGRYHTNWLNMIYPRLKLARNLLTEDGVILVSIDDREAANVQKLLNEIFGEDNFVGQLIIQTATDNNPTQVNTEHEYMLIFAKNKDIQPNWSRQNEAANLIQCKYEELRKQYGADNNTIQLVLRKWIKQNSERLPKVSHYDNVDDQGVFHDGDIANTKFGGYKYEILHPVTGAPCKIPEKGFRFPRATMKEMISRGDILFGADETTLIKPKKRLDNARDALRTLIYEDGRASTKVVEDLLGRDVFKNPKSHTILRRLIEFVSSTNDTVLDFFAGSATTAHSVMLSNLALNASRKFIMIQLPEPIDPKDKDSTRALEFCNEHNLAPNIAEIGKERIRRVIKKIEAEQSQKTKNAEENLPGMADEVPALDLGFKVFKLDASNIIPWDADFDNLENALFNAVENIKPDRGEADVLYELLLKYGLDLAVPIEEREIGGKTVYIIGAGALIVCLAKDITLDVVEGIAALKDELKPEIMRVVFKDSGFKDDVVKTNTVQILRQAGIEDVKSL